MAGTVEMLGTAVMVGVAGIAGLVGVVGVAGMVGVVGIERVAGMVVIAGSDEWMRRFSLSNLVKTSVRNFASELSKLLISCCSALVSQVLLPFFSFSVVAHSAGSPQLLSKHVTLS